MAEAVAEVRAPTAWRAAVCAYGLRAGLLIALLPLGSTGRFAMPFATFALALWCAVSALLVPTRSWLAMTAMLAAAALAAFVVLQAVPDAHLLPPAAIWQEAAKLVGGHLPETASVAPARTLATLPVLVVPLLVFALGLGIFEDEAAALSMMRFMAAVGTGAALFGLAQFAFFPDTLLIFAKPSYLDSVTTIFVNRNSAATFLGLTLLMLIALLFRAVERRPLIPTLLGAATQPARMENGRTILLLLGAGFIVLLALFLTKSRAGIGATGAAALLLLLVLPGPAGTRASASLIVRTARVGMWLVALAALSTAALVIFGQQTLHRAELRGTDDTRFCILEGLLRAADDYWPVGSGAGTFALVFPAYRDPVCGIYGAIDRAHNFFLEGAITLGAPFVALAALSTILLLAVLVRGVRRRRSFRFVPAVGLAALVLLLLHDTVDFSLQIPGIAMWAAALMSLCCGVATADLPWRQRKQEDNGEQKRPRMA